MLDYQQWHDPFGNTANRAGIEQGNTGQRKIDG